ncbi:MAG: UDP-N-acetylmuramoyl-L-alanyl-D-glutamate--2,6-diaminopimelate ligase [Puniceicoccales bacterium]|jgi:UDP-N-acetylmuramoyl-L-alanyl-D-glutamate--2,6-diaminopimelate ligase|nr:UDP-N-acetylmuramoyl-L-alanyl-D-glutamate--2,6-diaminopimelate ligase [Puniceicoccales bacterium]
MNTPLPPITLKEVFENIETASFSGEWKTPVASLRDDSRRVVPGCVFFAVPGINTDGERFIEDAIARGASAIVSTGAPSFVKHSRLAWVRVADTRRAFAAAAANFFRHPEKKLRVAGVTGTNGKTTVTTLLRWLLGEDGSRWGLLGTVRYELGERSLPALRTTPGAGELFGMMAQMVEAGCAGMAMELSSHAIDQGRAAGLAFETLAFTNLSRDHLDYHKNMENYFQVKAGAFLGGAGADAPKTAVVNTDDAAGRRLAEMLREKTRVLTFGENADADIRAENIRLGTDGSAFDVVWSGGAGGGGVGSGGGAGCGVGSVQTSLPGRYNVSNTLCALALASALGRDIGALLPALARFPGVPGRMERVAPESPYQIFVDYAHTDDALKNALEMLRPITRGRLLVVFGCGGDRDRGKRPAMTHVVQQLADFAWATADNPRKEPQERIFADMLAGVIAPEKIEWVEDRRRAISLALDAARPGDNLLIAGKGHETYQEFADITIPFDDRLVAKELLALKNLRPV